jgi:hypothetical protein
LLRPAYPLASNLSRRSLTGAGADGNAGGASGVVVVIPHAPTPTTSNPQSTTHQHISLSTARLDGLHGFSFPDATSRGILPPPGPSLAASAWVLGCLDQQRRQKLAGVVGCLSVVVPQAHRFCLSPLSPMLSSHARPSTYYPSLVASHCFWILALISRLRLRPCASFS